MTEIAQERARGLKVLLTLLKVTVSLGLVVLIVYKAGFAETVAKLRTASIFWLTMAFASYFLGVFFRAWRWKGLLEALGVKAQLGRLSWLYLIGFFFNQLIPTGVGGDAMRVYMLAKDGAGGTLSANSVIIDRTAGLYSLLLMGSVAMLVRPGLAPQSVALLLGGMTVGVSAGLALLLWSAGRLNLERLPEFARGRIGQIAGKFYASFAAYSWVALARAMAISILFNLLLILTNVFLARAFAVDVSLWHIFFFVPLISATLLLPISVNGAGTREWAYVYLFGQVGVAADAALAMSLSLYGLNLALGVMGGVCFAVHTLQEEREEREKSGEK